MVSLQFFDICACSFHKICHTFVGCTKFCGDIAADTLFHESPVSFREDFKSVNGQHFLVLILFNVELDVLACPDTSNLHHVKSQSSCLIRADISSAAHDFAGCKLFNIVLILQHLSLRVSKRDHNGKRETFRDGDNDNGDTNDDIVDPELEILCKRTVILVLTTEKINVALQKAIRK